MLIKKSKLQLSVRLTLLTKVNFSMFTDIQTGKTGNFQKLSSLEILFA